MLYGPMTNKRKNWVANKSIFSNLKQIQFKERWHCTCWV